MVVDLIDHSMLAGNINPLECIVILGIDSVHSCLICSVLEVKRRKDSVTRMLVQHNSGTSDVPCLLDPPESDILLTTAYHFEVVNRAEFEA